MKCTDDNSVIVWVVGEFGWKKLTDEFDFFCGVKTDKLRHMNWTTRCTFLFFFFRAGLCCWFLFHIRRYATKSPCWRAKYRRRASCQRKSVRLDWWRRQMQWNSLLFGLTGAICHRGSSFLLLSHTAGQIGFSAGEMSLNYTKTPLD